MRLSHRPCLYLCEKSAQAYGLSTVRIAFHKTEQYPQWSYREYSMKREGGEGELLFNISNDPHKLFRRYSRNMAGGKVLSVSCNNNNIGVNQNGHFKCLASLSSRICSMVMSPRPDNIPKSASVCGVGWERRCLSQSGYGRGDVSSSALLTAGSDFRAAAGVKVRITGPSGTSRGTSITSRWLAGMSTVCVTLMGVTIA